MLVSACDLLLASLSVGIAEGAGSLLCALVLVLAWTTTRSWFAWALEMVKLATCWLALGVGSKTR